MEERTEKAKTLGAKFMVGIEEDNKFLFLKNPTKDIYKMWWALNEQDPIAAKESVLRTLTIAEVSDMEIFDDMRSLIGAFSELGEIMAQKKSSLKIL